MELDDENDKIILFVSKTDFTLKMEEDEKKEEIQTISTQINPFFQPHLPAILCCFVLLGAAILSIVLLVLNYERFSA